MDPLTAIMLVVVSGVSLMVQIYSVGYMSEEGNRAYSRYFAYMSLFTASMIGLVLASNIIQVFVFWELVGLCSYLLIGFWFTRPSAANAAKKAFIVTRVGDFGFLLGILYLFFNQDALAAAGLNGMDIADLYKGVEMGLIAGGVATWVAAGIFAGAVGKSGQFPLHTWLPDAMEGPTPVSALIHAATMVTAGVFLVARFYPVFEASDSMMTVVAIVGGFTAIFAATMGLVMNDIKRVLAYSTVSQLGYMMLALGVGAYAFAIFHLFTHAFFKALLFLGSGSVNHASGTFDMRYMGGLRKHMPWTFWTFLIGSLALAGVFPTAGFWSKDEILASALHAGTGVGTFVFALGIIAALMTAFYMFRALWMTFGGEFRGGAEAEAKRRGRGGREPGRPPPGSRSLGGVALRDGRAHADTGGIGYRRGVHRQPANGSRRRAHPLVHAFHGLRSGRGAYTGLRCRTGRGLDGSRAGGHRHRLRDVLAPPVVSRLLRRGLGACPPAAEREVLHRRAVRGPNRKARVLRRRGAGVGLGGQEHRRLGWSTRLAGSEPTSAFRSGRYRRGRYSSTQAAISIGIIVILGLYLWLL